MDPMVIMEMLEDAAAAAVRMPQLLKMEIWYGRRILATSFTYELSGPDQAPTITWTSTWDLAIRPAVIHAWQAVVDKRDSPGKLKLVYQSLDTDEVDSHGHAMELLGLSGTVIRPVSLKQILAKESFGGVVLPYLA